MERFKIKCRECKGEGGVEVLEECYKPAQYCCGGCYTTIRCEICKGEGTQEIDFFEEVEGIVYDSKLTPEKAIKYLKELFDEIEEFM